MSKMKDRSWFVCPQWAALVAAHYPDDAAAGRALGTDPRVLARLRARTPVAKSTLLRVLRAFTGRHPAAGPVEDLVVDTRSR